MVNDGFILELGLEVFEFFVVEVFDNNNNMIMEIVFFNINENLELEVIFEFFEIEKNMLIGIFVGMFMVDDLEG